MGNIEGAVENVDYGFECLNIRPISSMPVFRLFTLESFSISEQFYYRLIANGHPQVVI